MILLDVLVAGLLLLFFAYFHHVLPALKMQAAATKDPVSPPKHILVSTEVASDTTEPETEETPETAVPKAQESSLEEPEEASSEEGVIVDNRTEWQKKFEEHFSDEIVMTENSYKSPNVSVELETIQVDNGNGQITYHVADIYVGSPENFTTYTANDRLLYFDTQDPMEMHEASNAILSMTGDFLTYQQSGFLIRNGEIYSDQHAYCDICIMYPDGSIETYLKGTYDKEAIMARDPVQVWNFGPMLLDENGKALETFNSSTTVMYPNPRSALGYYEPGHYCFVVVDGRQYGYSVGMVLDELAAVFEELGCKAAYNLDGGGSALMMFGDSRYSQMSNGGDRDLGDILVIRETEVAE